MAFFPSLLTSPHVSSLQTAKLKIIDPTCSRTIGIVKHKYRKNSETVESFIQYAMNFLQQKGER